MEKKYYVLLLIFLIGCAKGAGTNKVSVNDGMPESNLVGGTPSWMEVELRDVRTHANYKISDFKGKPILIESFAVWCPICTKQQDQIKRLHAEVGDTFVSISLDTDPNEVENQVRDHVELNAFGWYYSISPVELTQGLIDEFGIGVVNAPSAPVILVCEDLSSRLLDRGVKDTETLKDEIAKGCSG